MATLSRAQFGPTGLPRKDTVSKGLGTLTEKMAPKGQATLSEVRAIPARQSKALTSFAGKCTKNSALPQKQLTLLVWMVIVYSEIKRALSRASAGGAQALDAL